MLIPDRLNIRIRRQDEKFIVEYEEEYTYIPREYQKYVVENFLLFIQKAFGEKPKVKEGDGSLVIRIRHESREPLVILSVIGELLAYISAHCGEDVIDVLEYVSAFWKHLFLEIKRGTKKLIGSEHKFYAEWSDEAKEFLEKILEKRKEIFEKLGEEK